MTKEMSNEKTERKISCERGEYTTQLIRDDEVQKMFFEIAMNAAYMLAARYPSVAKNHFPCDIVQDVLLHVIKYDVEYDVEKKKSFSNFVRMLVENRYRDLLRELDADKRKETMQVSLNEDVSESGRLFSNSPSESKALQDILECDKFTIAESEDELVMKEFMGLLQKNSMIGKIKNDVKVDLYQVLDLKLQGHNNTEIANMFGVKSSKVTNLINRNKDILWDLCTRFMGDRIEMPER